MGHPDLPDQEPPVILGTPTIMEGLVLRWFRSTHDAVMGRHLLSVSRDGIFVAGSLHHVPASWVTQATAAFELLARNQREQAMDLVTHERHAGRGAGSSSDIRPVRHLTDDTQSA